MTMKTPFSQTLFNYFTIKKSRLIFATFWLLSIFWIISSGFTTDSYLLHVRGIPPPHPYPVDLVVMLLGATALHISLIILADIYVLKSWKAFIMLLITMPFFFYFAIFAMHAPPPLGVMILCQFLMFLLFLVLSFWQAGLYIFRRFFRKA